MNFKDLLRIVDTSQALTPVEETSYSFGTKHTEKGSWVDSYDIEWVHSMKSHSEALDQLDKWKQYAKYYRNYPGSPGDDSRFGLYGYTVRDERGYVNRKYKLYNAIIKNWPEGATSYAVQVSYITKYRYQFEDGSLSEIYHL